MKILQSLAMNGTNFKNAYFGYYSICQTGTNELAFQENNFLLLFFNIRRSNQTLPESYLNP